MITTYFANLILDTMLDAETLYFSIHDGPPGSAGADNEMDVTRILGTYDPAASKERVLADPVAILDCPVGEVQGWSIWDAITAGNCLFATFLHGAMKAFTGEGSAELITCPAHGFVADDRVVFYDDGVGTLPTGVSEATLYHVISTGLTTDAFKVSATQGGSAINISATGQGLVAKVTPKTIANDGDTFNLTVATIRLP